MAQQQPQRKISGPVLGGIALAGIAAAYYLYGTERGKRNRVKMRGWYLKAKGEVLQRLEQIKEIDREKYFEIIESVLGRYRRLKDVGALELRDLTRELQSYWDKIKSASPASEGEEGGQASSRPRRRRSTGTRSRRKTQ